MKRPLRPAVLRNASATPTLVFDTAYCISHYMGGLVSSGPLEFAASSPRYGSRPFRGLHRFLDFWKAHHLPASHLSEMTNGYSDFSNISPAAFSYRLYALGVGTVDIGATSGPLNECLGCAKYMVQASASSGIASVMLGYQGNHQDATREPVVAVGRGPPPGNTSESPRRSAAPSLHIDTDNRKARAFDTQCSHILQLFLRRRSAHLPVRIVSGMALN
ncbi:hypothetical protein BD414DRAFT_485767 [Trametes punicea]|nr:hypothetical protein BD414DRAFT_485767 [Trametes punicea]